MAQICFDYLIIVQFVVVVLHDWLHIPGWTHGRQVQAVLGRNKMFVATLINSIFPGLAVAFDLIYWNKPKPSGVLQYWVAYCAITVVWAITAWWIPYFRGTDDATKKMYLTMYAGTHQVLPARGDNPRPNLLHLFFHTIFLTDLILAVILWAGKA